MSSTDDEYYSASSQKKRKISPRACDNCRRRKIKCNVYEKLTTQHVNLWHIDVGEESKELHNGCLNCIHQNVECTFKVEPKKRGCPKGYVEGLENRIRMLEDIVKKLSPDYTVLHNLIYPLDPEYAVYLTGIPASTAASLIHSEPSAAQSVPEKESSSVLDIVRKITALSLGSEEDPSRDEDFDYAELTNRIKMLCIRSANERNRRFWGKSSGAMLMKTAIEFKNEHAKGTPAGKRKLLQNRRHVFWDRLPWEKDYIQPAVTYDFPPATLALSLIDAYFENVNLFYPLLHRPTFQRNIEDNLHQRDAGFGGVFLLVCAVGSRYLKQIDKEALLDGSGSNSSAGWKWYSQVQIVKQSLLDPPTLYDLQCYCLAIEYINACYSPQAMWILTGFGIRLAQDVGAHHRRVPLEMLTVEDELWKRAFWVLVAMDRMISMGVGRPVTISDDNFDVDMPVECDDEYWEHPDPTQRFKQPKHIPSTVTAFNQLLQLYKIMTFAMNTVYSMKTKFWEIVLKEWEQHVVTDLDSALNNWVSSLPEYLRWDPARTDVRFYKISASLITRFHYVQILIHRPYIGMKDHPSSLAFSSLAICTSAARSCSLILDQQMKRIGITYPYMQISAVTSALVLLLNTWGGKKKGVPADPRVMRQVEMCKAVLKKAEDRYRSAGVLLDILNELTTAGQLLFPEDEVALMGMMPSSSSSTYKSENNSAMSPHSGFSSAPEASTAVHGGGSYPFSRLNIHLHPHSTSYQETGPYIESDSGIHNYNTSSTYNPFDEMFNMNSNTGHILNDQQAAVDSNTMAMWLSVPNGFEIDEWNMFLASFQD